MTTERLQRQITFLLEIDRLKTILRRTLLGDGSRRENSAEHSWHITVMAIVLAEYAAGDALDLPHVMKLLLVHDLVEIDAGDTFCYDAAANHDKLERETRAAERLFGLLPPEQAVEFRALWDEFETAHTPAARFANALDRMQPILLNNENAGGPWREHNISRKQVETRNQVMDLGAPALWEFIQNLITEAERNGYFGKDKDAWIYLVLSSISVFCAR